MTISKSIRSIIGQAAIFAATTLATVSLGSAGAQAQGAFYQAAEHEIAGRPGTLIRQEPMFGAPVGATAHRVLYRSTDPAGAADRRVGRRDRAAGPRP